MHGSAPHWYCDDRHGIVELTVLYKGLECCWCAHSSVVRSFRFTATLTAMQLATSLVRAVLALGEAAQTATRQRDAESKKKGRVRRRPSADFIG